MGANHKLEFAVARRDDGEGYLYTEAGLYCWRLKRGGEVVAVIKRKTATERRLAIKAKKLELEAAGDHAPSKDAKTQTVRQYLEWWLTNVVAPSKSPKTHQCYDRDVRLYIAPHVGDKVLIKLTSAHVTEMMAALAVAVGERGKPLGPRSRDSALITLKTALNYAVKESPPRLMVNVALAVKGPKAAPNTVAHLRPDAIDSIRLADCDSRYLPMVLLILVTGVRTEEAAAWTWHDDVREGDTTTLRVNKTLYWLAAPTDDDGKRIAAAEWRFEDVKRPKSRRVIALGDDGRKALAKIRDEQAAQRRNMGDLWPDNKLVLTTECGTPVKHRNLQRALDAILKRLGVPHVGLHALRRAFGNTMARGGVPMHVLQDLMGHESITTTERHYLEVLSSDHVAAAAVFDRAS